VQVKHEGGWSHTVVDGPLRVKPPFTQNILQKIEAAPWPYLPVDLLPIFVALGAKAEGQMMYWNKVYEGALGWTSELAKFGAHCLQCDPHRVVISYALPMYFPPDAICMVSTHSAFRVPSRSRTVRAKPSGCCCGSQKKATIQVHRHKTEPRRFFIYEQYKDDAALEAHRAAPHFLQFVRKELAKVADRGDGDLFEPLG